MSYCNKTPLTSQIIDLGGSECLDDLVDKAASILASNANNGGLDAQLHFLRRMGISDGTIYNSAAEAGGVTLSRG